MTDFITPALPFIHRGAALPQELRESLDRYAQHGVPTGDFLQAVLANDLFEACGRADDRNVWIIPVVCAYVYNELPSSCWGSREKVAAWIEHHAQLQRAAQEEQARLDSLDSWPRDGENAPFDEHGREA